MAVVATYDPAGTLKPVAEAVPTNEMADRIAWERLEEVRAARLQRRPQPARGARR